MAGDSNSGWPRMEQTMRPLFHPQLVNDPFGDPALYVDCLFEKRALLFDLGDIRRLAPRKILRLSHIFVSHAHMDHFMGFDWLLRISLGREKAMHLFGPARFLEQVEHKLAAYTWNLVANYSTDFTLTVTEVQLFFGFPAETALAVEAGSSGDSFLLNLGYGQGEVSGIICHQWRKWACLWAHGCAN